jgi:hypothetical protein
VNLAVAGGKRGWRFGVIDIRDPAAAVAFPQLGNRRASVCSFWRKKEAPAARIDIFWI